MSTITAPTHPAEAAITVPGLVAHDLYRDVHKAIRVDLFGLVTSTARLDPASYSARSELAAQVRKTVDFLEWHAHHEDTAITPVLEVHLPSLAERIEADHGAFEGRGAFLCHLADAAVDATGADRRALVHHLYLDLAGFTSAYLAHQDVEERELMPKLEAAVGVGGVMEIHQQILQGIPPELMASSLAMMLPAMNVDDRTELLGGMQAGAPPEVFAGVWGLAGSVLTAEDHRQVGERLGLA